MAEGYGPLILIVFFEFGNYVKKKSTLRWQVCPKAPVAVGDNWQTFNFKNM